MAKEVNCDAILAELGQFGRYQILNYCLILIPIMFSAVYNAQYVFNAGTVPHRCAVPECESPPYQYETGEWGLWALGPNHCARPQPSGDGACAQGAFNGNVTVACDRHVYGSHNTIVAEFNLACQEWKRTLVGTIHSAGLFAALPLTGYVSDTFGRRTAFILTAVAAALMGLIRSFSVHYIMYLVFEFLDAMLGSGVYSTGFILALEMVGLKRRVLGGNIISSSFAIGQVILALVAWKVPYWRHLTRALYVPSFLFIFYYFLIEESVRWLLSKGRKQEAAKIILKAAIINKKELSPESMKQLESTEELPEVVTTPTSGKEKKSLFIQVLKSKILMSRLCICSFWWITVTFIYYGLSINSVSLAGNQYVNFMLTSLVEIPGYALSVLTLDRFGRKSAIMTAFFVCGTALIALPFIPIHLAWIRTCLTMLGKLCISMAFSSIYIYTSELFPTEARHSMLGSCSMIGRIGSIVAPQTPLLVGLLWLKVALTMLGKLCISMTFASIYIYTIELYPTESRASCMSFCSMMGRVGSLMAPSTPLLMEVMVSLPYLIFGVMAGISGCLMLLTPETLRLRLPDTIEQAEAMAVAPRTRNRTDILVD